MNPTESIILKPFTLSNDSIRNKEGIYFVNEPEPLMSNLVVFALSQKSLTEYFGVFLPGPRKHNTESFLNFNNTEEIRFKFTDISSCNFLKDVEQYYAMWNHYEHKT